MQYGIIETYQEAEANGHIHFTFPVQSKEHRVERNQLETRFNEQMEALVSFQKTLPAYWAFQGWGNDPDSFDEPFLTTIKSYFRRLRTRRIHSIYEKWVNLIWNYDSWHFVSPTYPKAVFLDSRTQRDYNNKPNPVKFGKMIEEEIGCPKLISKLCWELVSEKLKESKWERNHPLIILSACSMLVYQSI